MVLTQSVSLNFQKAKERNTDGPKGTFMHINYAVPVCATQPQITKLQEYGRKLAPLWPPAHTMCGTAHTSCESAHAVCAIQFQVYCIKLSKCMDKNWLAGVVQAAWNWRGGGVDGGVGDQGSALANGRCPAGSRSRSPRRVWSTAHGQALALSS